MTTYDPDTATFRGTVGEIAATRAGLLAGDSAAAGLAATGAIAAGSAPDPLLDAMRGALTSPVFRVEVTVSGPGGHLQHRIVVGRNAVAVRESPVRADLAELNGFPVTFLPGALARLVHFRPGTPAPVDAAEVPVTPADVLALGEPDESARLQAWSRLEPALRDAGYADPEDPSWQLVRSRATWTTDGGEDAHEAAVHLRSGPRYFLVGGDENAAALVPVDSIVAWQSLVSVLPGQGETRQE